MREAIPCSASTHIISIITDSMRKSINHTTTYDIISDTTTTRRQQAPRSDQHHITTPTTQYSATQETIPQLITPKHTPAVTC
jgi:hypothetical protein